MDGLLGNPYMQESHSGLIRLDETGRHVFQRFAAFSQNFLLQSFTQTALNLPQPTTASHHNNSTGNFRNDNEARYPALNHYDHRPDYRRRSRSPRSNYGRRDNSVGSRDIVRGGGGMHGAGTGDDSVNLLLNLSQMLRHSSFTFLLHCLT